MASEIPINNLTTATFSRSDTRRRFRPNDRLRLRRWPNFKQLDYRPLDVKVAVLLNKGAQGIDELSIRSGLPAQDVERFLVQCHALDYLDVIDLSHVEEARKWQQQQPRPTAQPVRPLASPRQSLFNSLRRHLGIA